MADPDLQNIDQIYAVLQDIAEAEASVEELKERLLKIPAELAASIATSEGRLRLASHLYWAVPELPAKAIASGVLDTNVYRMLENIPPENSGVNCYLCKQPIICSSRTQMKELIRDALESGHGRFQIVCADCDQLHRERIVEAGRHEREAVEQRFFELRTMPYGEYLKTPEWQDRRKRHLKSAGYRCQVCNAGGTVLDVHHRTYERRGCEYYKDLIVLCRGCHETFHKHGKLMS